MAILDENHSDTDGNIYNDPCNLSLAGLGTPIVEGSVSPWVDHPALLNDWAAQFGKPTPNMIRFTVLFDRTTNLSNGDPVDPSYIQLLAFHLKGVTGLYLMSDPN
jgi:hypothetical protein